MDRPWPSSLSLVVEGHPRPVGGIMVERSLPTMHRRRIGPFVFLDHMGPVAVAPGVGFDVWPHPHIGLSTVTYLFAGEIVHRDSLGSVQTIRPGDVNLMTAGKGIVHSERSGDEWRQRGGLMHGLQFWTALPIALEESEPSVQHVAGEALPHLALGELQATVVLGEALGGQSPVKAPGAPVLIDVRSPSRSTLEIPKSIAECAIYVVEGEVRVEGTAFGPHHLLVRADGASLDVEAAAGTRFVVIGGPTLDGDRFIDWNFVSSSKERIERAKTGWRDRRFPAIPGDDQEFIPLPDLRRPS